MRVKRGTTTHARHTKQKKALKGFGKSRQSSYRLGHQALIKALSNSYRDRRTKKRDLRSLWITRINAGLATTGLNYSQFMGQLKQSGVELDRKILSELATNQPEVFQQIAAAVAKKVPTETAKSATKS